MEKARLYIEYSILVADTWENYPLKKNFTVDLTSVESRARY